MKELIVKGASALSKILVNESISNFEKYIDAEKVVVITDANIIKHYSTFFEHHDVVEIGIGESIKNINTVHDVIGKLIELECDRSTFLVGIGGGVVCDITGFVASVFMRGMRFGFVSTTLLSQVDASVGGKNGVNYFDYKNIIGVFNQPEFVICDLNLLKTLPKEELLNGYAEIIKHCLIADEKMFERLEQNWQEAINIDSVFLEELLSHSIRIKAEIVNIDEKEKGERRKLNFGHTYGHAIERLFNIGHGKAVSIGMMVAAKLSEKKKLITEVDTKRIEDLLSKFDLPVISPASNDKALENLLKDKKKEDKFIYYILLEKIGKAIVEKISIDDLKEDIDDLC